MSVEPSPDCGHRNPSEEVDDWRVKGYAPIEIPPGRNLYNIDRLISNTTDESKRKELIQQKKQLQERQKDIDAARAYLENYRSNTGWKALLNDPDINAAFTINRGLIPSYRRLLCDTKAESSNGSLFARIDDIARLSAEQHGKWILNLSKRFFDDLDRENFFATYVEKADRWRRVTVSCSYRDAEKGSLEEALKELQSEREKSARIYETLRNSLPEIQFYDTVTNLRLSTKNDKLHVYVTEDVNETLSHFDAAYTTFAGPKDGLPLSFDHLKGRLWDTDDLGTRLETTWMLHELKHRLEISLPDSGSSCLATEFDGDLLNLQISLGMLDVGSLCKWLTRLLESPYASVRREPVPAALEMLYYGATNGDRPILTNGLKCLFEWFKAMKLSVADRHTRIPGYFYLADMTRSDPWDTDCTTFACLKGNANPSFSRRGRGQRKNRAYWKSVIGNDDLQNPFERDCLFGNNAGGLTVPATSYMDSGCAVPRCMSMKYLRELGLESQLSTDCEDPGLVSIGARDQKAKMTGIVRNISFRIKGSSTTFKGDFYVSELLDSVYDILFGWQFMCSEAADILEKAGKVYQHAKAYIGRARSAASAKFAKVASEAHRRVSDFVDGMSSPPPPPYSLVSVFEGDFLTIPQLV